MLFRSSSASIGLKTSSLIGRVARYTPSSTYVLRLDSLQNLFDKPNEQSQACLASAMARKGGRWALIESFPSLSWCVALGMGAPAVLCWITAKMDASSLL